MKKQLIKEVDINGVVWYATFYNGVKVTQYTHELNVAEREFNEFTPYTPSKTIIKEEEV